jgi:hypothetical protein
VSTRIVSRIAQLGFRTKLFGALSIVFLALSFGKIHGTSIALSSKFWAPKANHFLFKPLVESLEKRVSAETMTKLRAPLQADPKFTRSDEWSISTPWTLSQFNTEPRFPVRNRNMGVGQNMLMIPWVPVLHLSVVARPITWGYMLFGQQVGLAWYWWFSSFFCFVTLYLLIEVLLPRDRFLAVLGAFWFCSSAYVIAWSHYPAYLIAFANLALLGTNFMLRATSLRNAIGSGLLAGYGLTGVVMYMYVPWIVPLAYMYAAMLFGLIVRDRLIHKLDRRLTLFGLAAALAVVGVVLGSFFASTLPEMRMLAQSSYPGVRRLNGGDCSLARLFGGFYNFLTLRKPLLRIPFSEWAGFFLFFPTIVLAAILSRRVRRRLDAVAWSLIVVAFALMLYGEVKFPQWLANVTLFSRFQGYRAQMATGLSSILLSLYVLRKMPPAAEAAPPAASAGESMAPPGAGGRLRARIRALVLTVISLSPRWRRSISRVLGPVSGLTRYQGLMIGAAVLGGFAFFLTTGSSLQAIAQLYRSKATVPWQIWLISVAATGASVLLLLGYRRIFAAVLVPALILTAGDFNPLSRGFPPLEKSEMWQAIRSVKDADKESGRTDSMWLVSGGPHAPLIGTMASMMGARSMTGCFFHPQLGLWRTLDPERAQETMYNRFAETHLFPLVPGDPTVRFTLPGPTNFNIRIAPDNPRLRELGVRYALTYDRHTPYEAADYRRIYISSDGRLRIYDLLK